ncbi:MAG TPA: hypothetical protein VF784_16110 [Anaerolineales bacterium]
MDEDFGFDEPVRRPRPQLSIWDMLAVLALLAAVGMGTFFVFLFLYPSSPINLLQPGIPTPFLLPTATITPIQLEPTWTPTFASGTDTPTLAPTITVEPSDTPISLVPPSKTPKPTATPKAPYSVTISAIQSTIIHPDLDCNWTGIGGTVVDASGAPVLYRTLRLTGSFNGQPVDKLTVSGTALDYGQSGFEFVLGTTPLATNKLLTLQLLDQGGLPLAANVYVVTYNDCNKNLILVRFKQNK